jgi:hypothetical protein
MIFLKPGLFADKFQIIPRRRASAYKSIKTNFLTAKAKKAKKDTP